MKRLVLTGLTLAAIGLMTSAASAHKASFKTTIEIDGLVGVTVNDYRYYGTVSSPKDRCVPGRTVKIFSLTPEGSKLIDTDRTSRNGFWFGGGDFTPPGVTGTDGVRVRVARRDIGRHGHRHACRADADSAPIL
jgi:hypothetical protein